MKRSSTILKQPKKGRAWLPVNKARLGLLSATLIDIGSSLLALLLDLMDSSGSLSIRSSITSTLVDKCKSGCWFPGL